LTPSGTGPRSSPVADDPAAASSSGSAQTWLTTRQKSFLPLDISVGKNDFGRVVQRGQRVPAAPSSARRVRTTSRSPRPP
jgi:hypothetical protein